MLIVLDAEKLEDGAKELLVPGLIRALYDGDGEEGLGHVSALPGDLVGFWQALELIGEGIMQIIASQRPHTDVSAHGVPEFNFGKCIDQFLPE